MADERDGRTSSFGQDPLLDLLTRAVLLLCCLPIAPALLGGFALAQWLRRRDERLLALTSLVSIMGGAVLALLFHPTAAVLALAEQVAYQVHHAWQWARLLQALVPLWAMSLLLLPSCGLLLLLFRPIPIEERALAHMRHEEARLGRVRTRAKKHVRRGTPDEQEGQGVLGAWVDGDLGWRKKQWLVFPTRELGQHGVIIGASGTGKTETLLRLAVLAAKTLGWQVIYIDAKGDVPTAIRVVAAMRQAGVARVKCFPAEFYNGWVGDTDALLNRLLAIEDYSESAYYRAIAENLVSLALEAGPGLPTNSAEFLRRLRMGSLLHYYKEVKGTPEEVSYLEGLPKRDLAGVYSRYRATFQKLRGKLDGSWSYDDVDAAYILLDGLALRELASGLGRYLIEDFAHYSGLRKAQGRRVLFIFDELSAVDADTTNLFERVRSKGVSIFVSGQSYEGLAYKGLLPKANRLISAATTILLHQTSDPVEMLRRAGTRKVPETGYHFENDEEATGRGVVRIRDELRVAPDHVRQLETGEIYVIAHGQAALVQVAQIQVDAASLAEANRYIVSLGQGTADAAPASPLATPSGQEPVPGRSQEVEQGGLPATSSTREAIAPEVENDPDRIE